MTKSYLSLGILLTHTGLAKPARTFFWDWDWESLDGYQAFDVRVGDHTAVDCAKNVYIHPTMNCSMEGAIFVGSGRDSFYQWYDFSSADAETKMFFTCDDGDGEDCFTGRHITFNVLSEPKDAIFKPLLAILAALLIAFLCICYLSLTKIIDESEAAPRIPTESTQVRPTNHPRSQTEGSVFYNGLADLVVENHTSIRSPTRTTTSRSYRDMLIRERLEFRKITLPSPLETFEHTENFVFRQEKDAKTKEPRQRPDLEEGTASQSTDITDTNDDEDGKISSSFRSFFAFVRGLSDLQHHQECCSICLEPYQIGDVVARMKKQVDDSDQKRIRHCMHWFHKDCIVQWLKNHDECPLCRVDIIQS